MKIKDKAKMLFNPLNILYEFDDFEIAWGIWKEEEVCMGIRWKNYPFERSGDKAWIVIPRNLQNGFLKTLIGERGAKNDNILKILS